MDVSNISTVASTAGAFSRSVSSDIIVDIASNLLVIVPIAIALYSGKVESITGHVLSLIVSLLWIGFAFLKNDGRSIIGKVISVIGLIVLIYLWYSFDSTDADYPNSYEIGTNPNSCIAKYNARQYRGNNVCFVIKNDPVSGDQ